MTSMNKKIKRNIFWILVLIILAGVVVLIARSVSAPGKYDQFAQCLEEKGAKFYGAFWCPHCQNQKKMFGKSQKYLPYVECSTPNGQGQKELCNDAGIEGYPTWVFADESRLSGEVPLATLAEKTMCALPIE